jgi:hypothetical protein
VLAALLKLADELSEDSTRAAGALMNANQLQGETLLRHTFASVLDSVKIKHDERSVELYFDLSTSQALATYQFQGKRMTLLQYIYTRTLKTHFERVYCMRFLRPGIELDGINVKVEIWNDEHTILMVDPPIKYRLEEKGYPEYENDVIYKICPELKNFKPNVVMKRLRGPAPAERPRSKSKRSKNVKNKKR